MLHGKEIKITIPKYPRQIELSKAQLPKYWEWNGNTIKSRGKKLLKKYLKIAFKNSKTIKPYMLKEQYKIAAIYKKKVLAHLESSDYKLSIEDLQEKLYDLEVVKNFNEAKKIKFIIIRKNSEEEDVAEIANETQAGKPKKMNITFNAIWGGTMQGHTRNKMVDQIRASASSIMKNYPPVMKDMYPLLITVEVHDVIENPYDSSNQRWDADFTDIYKKVLVDQLTDENVIIDDERLLVRAISYFVPLPQGKEHKDRYIDIIITKLNDPRVMKNSHFLSLLQGRLSRNKSIRELKTISPSTIIKRNKKINL